MKPNFNNCILNVVSSIMNKYEVNSKYITNKIVEEKIKNAKKLLQNENFCSIVIVVVKNEERM